MTAAFIAYLLAKWSVRVLIVGVAGIVLLWIRDQWRAWRAERQLRWEITQRRGWKKLKRMGWMPEDMQ